MLLEGGILSMCTVNKIWANSHPRWYYKLEKTNYKLAWLPMGRRATQWFWYFFYIKATIYFGSAALKCIDRHWLGQ